MRLFGSFQRENFRKRRDHWLLGRGRREQSVPGGSLAMEGKQLGSSLSKPFYSSPFLAIFSTQRSLVPGYFWKGCPFFPNRLFQTGKSCSIFIKAIFDIPGLQGPFPVDETDWYTSGKRDFGTKFLIQFFNFVYHLPNLRTYRFPRVVINSCRIFLSTEAYVINHLAVSPQSSLYMFWAGMELFWKERKGILVNQ